MTIDLASFEAFLTSLSQISRLNFQVWDGNELVFASGADPAEETDLKAHQDFSARVMKQGSYLYEPFNNQSFMSGTPIKYHDEGEGSLIAYGLNSNGKPVPAGDIPSGKAFYEKEMEAFLAQIVSLMEDKWETQIETDEMAEELAQNFEDLALYGRISTQIKSLKFSDQMLKALMDEVLDTMRIDLAFVQMPNRPEYLARVSTEEFSEKIPDQSSFINNLINAIPQENINPEEDYFIANDSRLIPEYAELHPEPYRFLAVKITQGGATEGWMGLASFNLEEIFRQSELRLLISMAKQTSVLMANIDLYRDLENFVINVVKSLVYAIEAKDVYTRGHSERVNKYCMLMADRLNLDENEKEALNWASILHDIGKIGIPESILNKPGRLDDDEFGVIQEHPKKGFNILGPLLEQLSSSIPSILHHHERYDGKGYPDGLKGEEIPELARIIAIADTFDAINSTRAYRAANSPEKAMGIIDEVAGTQLDPEFAKVFKEAFIKDLGFGKEEKGGK